MLRAALTETRNIYPDMPATVEELPALAGRLEAIRRANVDHHVELIRRADAAGARVIGLGELFPSPYFALSRDEIWHGMAESASDGPTVATLRQLASELGMVIVAPIYERDGAERFNTAVVVDADGSVAGTYRKSHIPAGNNEQGSFDERFYYGRSELQPLLPVFSTAVGCIGVAICYDRHFEGVMSRLRDAGAQLVFSPAVTFGEKSRRLWESEFAVDAARHRLFIGGSNRRGQESPWNQDFFGGSHFVGPDGRLPDQSGDPELVIADFDLESLERPDPAGWDLRGDRRL